MMPRSARDGWLEELLDYLDERQDINNGGGANDYMRWHDALKLAIDALKTINSLSDEALVTVDEAIEQNAELLTALREARATLWAIVSLTFLDSDIGNAAERQVKSIDATFAKIGGDA